MRKGSSSRKTSETEITVDLDLDGTGKNKITTGIGFFDHLLSCFSKHSLIDLEISAKGDLEVDMHHTVEDIGLVLGEALDNALKEKKIVRMASICVPMDDALSCVCIDISGRPYLKYEAEFKYEKIGELRPELLEHFFRSITQTTKLNLHIKVEYGEDDHHKAESMFKAFAKALRAAITLDDRLISIPSTKGTI